MTPIKATQAEPGGPIQIQVARGLDIAVKVFTGVITTAVLSLGGVIISMMIRQAESDSRLSALSDQVETISSTLADVVKDSQVLTTMVSQLNGREIPPSWFVDRVGKLEERFEMHLEGHH